MDIPLVKTVYEYIGVPYPRISLVVVMIAGALIAAMVWKTAGSSYQRAAIESLDFNSWAIEFAQAGRGPQQRNALKDRESDFADANALARPVYNAVIDSLKKGINAYRQHGYPNIYVDLPAIPESVFGGDAAAYRGAILFSRNCSWSIEITKPETPMTGPNLKFTMMDGDGHIKSAVGVGSVQFWYDFASTKGQIATTGLVAPILSGLPKSVSPSGIDGIAAQYTKLLIEHQLANCGGVGR